MAKKRKDESEIRKQIQEAYEQNELDSIFAMRHRARSIAAGTAFGGVVEITMRTENNYMYAQMQPIEVVELIEQLAAGIGVEVALRPKVNFASWRGWEEVIDQRIGWDKIAWKGSAAWQLGGEKLEKNAMQLESGKEIKQLSPSKDNDSSILDANKNTRKKRTTKKVESNGQ